MKLIIDGRRQTEYLIARRLIVVDKQDVWLQQAMYSLLLRLATWQKDGLEWVPLSAWHECYQPLLYRYIYRLRSQIYNSGLDVENRVSVGYRLIPVEWQL